MMLKREMRENDVYSILVTDMLGHIFLRNDDVVGLDKEFRFFFDAAVDHAIPVVHAVIPGRMEEGLIRFLNRAKEKNPGLLDIVQHGWIHQNYSRDKRIKYEFGVSRSYRSQKNDICLGLKKMRSAFGDHFLPAFVPPYHGYDQQTWKILKEENFQIFSAGTRGLGPGPGMIELPVTLSLSCYDDPKKVSINKAVLIMECLIKNACRAPVAGVVTHHADFRTMSFRKELMRFFKMIAALKKRKEWQILLFSDFLSKNK